MFHVTTSSFVILINGVATSFFKPTRGIRHVCLLSPYIFILVEKGMSRSILEARRVWSIHGVNFGRKDLSHLLFMDEDLLSYFWSCQEGC